MTGRDKDILTLRTPREGDRPSVMAPAYKVEELLALRDSVSESAVSLDKFADEVVVKGNLSISPSPLVLHLTALRFPI